MALPSLARPGERPNYIVLGYDSMVGITFDSGNGSFSAHCQFEVIGKGRMRVGIILRSQAVSGRQAIQIGHAGASNHSAVAVIFFYDNVRVVELRKAGPTA